MQDIHVNPDQIVGAKAVQPTLGFGMRNGQLLYGTGTRGLTIVEVEPSTAEPLMHRVLGII